MLFVKILISLTIVYGSKAQYQGCDFVQRISSAGQSIIIKYPGNVNSGFNCRYQIIAPVNTVIEASCNFTIPGVS